MTVSRSGSEPTFFSSFGRHLISLVLAVGLTAACFLEANEEAFGWTGLLALLIVMLGNKLPEKPVAFRRAFGNVFLLLVSSIVRRCRSTILKSFVNIVALPDGIRRFGRNCYLHIRRRLEPYQKALGRKEPEYD
jgi:hypothetical protein